MQQHRWLHCENHTVAVYVRPSGRLGQALTYKKSANRRQLEVVTQSVALLFELTADKSQLHHQCRTANNKTLTPTRKQ
jgi:hypothetical protein